MERAAALLRGTVRVRVECAYPERVLNLCGAHGVRFTALTREEGGALSFTVPRRDRTRIAPLLAPLGARVTLVRDAGAPALLRRLRRRYVLLAGLALVCALAAANSFFIWDFAVSGNETVPTEKILRALERQGLHRGSFAYSFRPQELCNRVLPELPELAWLTVNVRGSRACVLVRERVPRPEVASDASANVVAKRAALVTEVRAYEGKAMVTSGMTVAAGQLLISGAVETEGTERPHTPSRLVAGRGEVWGRTWHTLSARIPLQYEEKVAVTREEHAYALLFGQNRLKFGANGSSNLEGICDKITVQGKLTLPLLGALPLGWEKSTLRHWETRTVTRSRAEAEARGEALLREALAARIEGSVVSARVSSAVQDDWLLVTLSAECREQIGVRVPILVE